MIHNRKTRRAPKTKSEIRQDQITQAALSLIAGYGFRALTIDSLAKEVGVVPSAIYRHYPSKDAVLDALLDLIGQRLQENVQAIQQERCSALDRLHHLLIRHIELVCENKGIPRIVFSEEITGGLPIRRKRLYQIIQNYLAKVAEFIREGQIQGCIRPEVAPDTVSVMFLGLAQPAVILHLLSEGQFNVLKFQREAWHIFSETLQTESRTARLQKPTEPDGSQNKRESHSHEGAKHEK
jgi:AcrR family transcriptional regulator